MNILQLVKDNGNKIIRIFGIYIAWIICHYVAAHFYVQLCVPATLIGFILAPLVAPAPHCSALRWALYNGGNSIAAMWIILGAWIMQFLTPIRRTETL